MSINLPHLPERPSKPREFGLTMVMDKGLSTADAKSFIEMNASLTDLVKLGFGTSVVSPNIVQKIKLYQEAKIKTYLGGTLFEAFVIRGIFDDYIRLIFLRYFNPFFCILCLVYFVCTLFCQNNTEHLE